MITADGRKIDYRESGEGPAILFVPGSFSTPMAWNGIQKLLPLKYRLVATSICGYGDSEETRSIGDLDMAHEVRLIEAVVEKIGEPVHLVGHSFGGSVALAAALAGKIDVLSIATFEGNPIALLSEVDGGELFDATYRTGDAFEAAYHAGDRDAAGIIIDFWGGEGSFKAMPEPVQDYCRQTAYANVLDWRTSFQYSALSDDYAKLTMPMLVVRGGLANPAVVQITNQLQKCLPDCRPAVVDGANHFLNTSHPSECARLLSDFLQEVTG